MQVGPGKVLATNASQDKYFLVHQGGEVEKIDLTRAASLWAEGERKGWKRLGPLQASILRQRMARGGASAWAAAGRTAETVEAEQKRTRTIRVEQRKQELQARIDELTRQLSEEDGASAGKTEGRS